MIDWKGTEVKSPISRGYNGDVARLHRMSSAERESVLGRLSATLANRRGLSFAMVFGSFLSAEAFRDLDVAVWVTAEADPAFDLALAVELSAALGLSVDVRRINNAPLPFLFHVLRGRIVAEDDDRQLSALMERVGREYHDIAPHLRHATREAFAQ